MTIQAASSSRSNTCIASGGDLPSYVCSAATPTALRAGVHGFRRGGGDPKKVRRKECIDEKYQRLKMLGEKRRGRKLRGRKMAQTKFCVDEKWHRRNSAWTKIWHRRNSAWTKKYTNEKCTDEKIYERKDVRTKKYTNEKTHRRKNAQTKNNSHEKMRDENKQIRKNARRKNARRKNLQTKNCGRKTADKKCQTKNGHGIEMRCDVFIFIVVDKCCNCWLKQARLYSSDVVTCSIILHLKINTFFCETAS